MRLRYNYNKMLFGILLTAFLIIAELGAAVILANQKDYWHRLYPRLSPCPFDKESYDEVARFGERLDRIGVISYSLYGNHQKYAPTLLKSLHIIKETMPEWQARIYIPETLPDLLIEKMQAKGAEIIKMKKNRGHEAALWRFLPGKENLTFVSLDADNLFDLQSEIQKWYQSKKPFALFIKHKFLVPIMAGLWGARAGELLDIEERMSKYCEYWYGFDESFLKKEVWPIVRERDYYQRSHINFAYVVYAEIAVVFVLFTAALWISFNL